MDKTIQFIEQKVKLMQMLGLTDNETKTEKYVDMMKLVLQEQEDKNNITDSLINYNDEIVDIEFLGDMETIDISVTGDQLFYCNDILTKNSIGIAATADVILSIFQTEEDVEMNHIRLGMMKNRYGPRGMVKNMKINYNTLTITEADDQEEMIEGGDEFTLLEQFSD